MGKISKNIFENTFKGRVVVVGLSGGIACYKICTLICRLKEAGASVRIIATQNALNFITKTTLQALAKTPVLIEQFDIPNYDPNHISLTEEGDIFILAPATANTISKIANGVADNLLTSVLCAWKKPILIAPAMNFGMWYNPSTQTNISVLRRRGAVVLEPAKGLMASGAFGKGRLPDLDVILNAASKILAFQKNLKNKKIIITAGGTKEKIDDVRYIGNFSSGKMGKCLADVAYMRGADVTLISTVYFDVPYKQICVNSTLEMQKEVKENFKNADVLFMEAAVSDFRPSEFFDGKIKSAETLTLTLVKNPDILADICHDKREKQLVIGFALEGENLELYAKEKLAKKGCDFLVANNLQALGSEENEVLLLSKTGKTKKFKKAPEEEIATQIISEIFG